MPASYRTEAADAACSHRRLIFGPSPHALVAGYKWPSIERRLAATTGSGRPIILNRIASSNGDRDRNSETVEGVEILGDAESFRYDSKSFTFPGPLVLPGDQLAFNPRDAPQSVRAWRNLKYRNKVTADRRTIYVCAPPVVDEEIEYTRDWCQPEGLGARGRSVATPGIEDIIAYVQAHHHGMPVKIAPPDTWRFVPWDNEDGSVSTSIGLATDNEMTRIRTRKLPPDQAYTHQLNLTDILDALIEHVPQDAYAIVMLIKHDMYEDEEDDFCCGRAYGGSRVAVVSSARYHPALDESECISRIHAWPASHCACYVDGLVRSDKKRKRVSVNDERVVFKEGALHAAVSAHRSLPPVSDVTSSSLTELWLSRIVRTVVHELGHCFGMEHCTYYACIMQSTASVAEDVRQPPYLCPVCETKMLTSLEEASLPDRAPRPEGRTRFQRPKGEELKTLENMKVERYQALMMVCEKWKAVHMFAALRAWLQVRIEEEAGPRATT